MLARPRTAWRMSMMTRRLLFPARRDMPALGARPARPGARGVACGKQRERGRTVVRAEPAASGT